MRDDHARDGHGERHGRWRRLTLETLSLLLLHARIGLLAALGWRVLLRLGAENETSK
jgi:hypothetical protein